MIRPASSRDLPVILGALPAVVAAMRAAGNDQWGPSYPTQEDFARDLAEGNLFVDGNDVRGFAVLNLDEPEEYAPLPWSVRRPALVLHRMAVLPAFRRQGVAEGLFAFAEDQAAQRGLAGLISDTYSRNPAMNSLFAKRGWTRVGILRFPGREAEFVAWEKILGSSARGS